MDLTRFFLGLHAATHTSDVDDGRTPGSDRWLRGLSDDQLRVRPREDVNAIVWLLWHMADGHPTQHGAHRRGHHHQGLAGWGLGI